MAGKKRANEEKEYELSLIARHYLAKKTYPEIATLLQKQLGKKKAISVATISLNVRELLQRWKDASLASISEYINVELERINNLETVYWESWRASGGVHTIVNTKKERKLKEVDNEDKNKDQAEVEVSYEVVELSEKSEELVGDEKFLAGVRWCIDRRIQLLGLDAPKKIAPTNPDGTEEYSGEDKAEKRKAVLLALIEGAKEDKEEEKN